MGWIAEDMAAAGMVETPVKENGIAKEVVPPGNANGGEHDGMVSGTIAGKRGRFFVDDVGGMWITGARRRIDPLQWTVRYLMTFGYWWAMAIPTGLRSSQLRHY